MSELNDLAKRINKSSEQDKALSDADITRIAERLEKIKESGGSNAVEAATKAAVKESVSGFKSLFPDLSTIKNAFMRSNPILMSASELFRRSSDAIGKQSQLLEDSNKQIISDLEQKIAGFSQGVETTNNTYTELNNAIPDIKELYGETEALQFLLEEIVEQLKYANNLDENIIDEERRNKLQGLGQDENLVDTPNLTEDTNNLLSEMFETQQDQLRVASLDFLTGSGGTLGLMASIFGSTGLLGMSGPLMKGLSTVVKFGGRILGPIGLLGSTLYGLYDDFTSAEEVLGKDLSFIEKFQYAGNRLATALLAPVDWAIEYFTGEESDIRGTAVTKLTQFQDTMFGYLDGFLEIPKALFDSFIDITSTMFDGITTDTMFKDMPELIISNLKGSLERSYKTIGDSLQSTLDKGLGVLKSMGDYISDIIDGLKASLDTALNNSIDYISSGIEENIGFGLGSSIADKIRELKIGTPETQLSSGSGSINNQLETPKVNKSLEEYKPMIYREVEKEVQSDPKLIEAIKGLNESLKEQRKDTNIVTSAPVTSNSSTTVLKSQMSVYSGLRTLRPEG